MINPMRSPAVLMDRSMERVPFGSKEGPPWLSAGPRHTRLDADDTETFSGGELPTRSVSEGHNLFPRLRFRLVGKPAAYGRETGLKSTGHPRIAGRPRGSAQKFPTTVPSSTQYKLSYTLGRRGAPGVRDRLSMFWLRNRTEPSHSRKLAPPAWALLTL